MKKEEILSLFEEYEQAACEMNGIECWSAGDLQKLLRYRLWQNLTKVISKAKDACANVCNSIDDDFIDVNKMVELGSGAQRKVDDIMLTCYAYYLVASAANPLTDIFLIDMIDNGLHNSMLKKWWQSLFALAGETDKQIFVTTHSKETLCRLSQMSEEVPEYQQELCLYTLEKTKLKGFQAYKYIYEGLSRACENHHVKLRGISK